MKKLRITSGPLKIVDSTKNKLSIKSEDGRSIVFIPGLHPDAEGNSELILDALKVANKIGYTPTMLMDERQELLDKIKAQDDAMREVLDSEYTLAELISQRKVFHQYLKEAHERLSVRISDPLTKELDPKSKDYDFIKLLETLID